MVDVKFVVITFAKFLIYWPQKWNNILAIYNTQLNKEIVFDGNFHNLGKRLFPLGQNHVILSRPLNRIYCSKCVSEMQSVSHILNNRQEATPTWFRFHENGVDNLNGKTFWSIIIFEASRPEQNLFCCHVWNRNHAL